MSATTKAEIFEAELQALPPLTLRVVMLIRYEGMTFAAAAKQLKISEQTCARLYCRAVAHLQEKVEAA